MPNGKLYDYFNDRFDRLELKLDKFGERVSALEVWKAVIVGKLTLVAAIIGIPFYIAIDWVRKKINI